MREDAYLRLPFDDRAARDAYLEQVHARYGVLTLPLGLTQHPFSLQATYQPLTLRSDPLAAEDLPHAPRRGRADAPSQEGDERDEQGTGSDGGYHPEAVLDLHAPRIVVHTGAEALARSPTRRMVVLGGPGTGKTTLLKYLIGAQAQQAHGDPAAPLPIFIALPDLARSGTALEHYLPGLVRELGLERSWASVLWEAIGQGQAFLCLDSLDEVAPALRPEMINFINRWARQSGGTWIVGSRFTEYKGGQFAPGRFTEWELQPLEPTTRRELARRLVPVLHHLLPVAAPGEPPDPEVVVQAIETHPQAATWGENPLLFSLAVAAQVQQGHLPTSRAALYQQVLEALLMRRESAATERAVVLRLLSDLALALHQAKGRTFTLVELFDLLPQLTNQEDEPRTHYNLAHRLLNTGVFEVIAHETYGFCHQSFQEYLAAVALAQGLVSQSATQQATAWNLAWSKRTYSRWTEVLRLMVGVLVRQHGTPGVEAARRWLEALVAQRATPEGDVGGLAVLLALRSLGELGETSGAGQEQGREGLAGVFMDRWAEELLEAARHRYIRRGRLERLLEEVQRLSALRREQVITALVAGLHHQEAAVRIAALEVLKAFGEQGPIAPLLAALDDEDGAVRVAAVQALGSRTPVETLLILLQDRQESLRQAAATTLGTLGQHIPVEALLAMLRTGRPVVRKAALDVLARAPARVPVASLLAALQDSQEAVRSAAVQAVGALESPPLEPLLAMLHDPDHRVRQAAVKVIGAHAAPLDPLLEAAGDQDQFVAARAVEALGKQGTRAPVAFFLTTLRHEDGWIASAAAEALVGLEPLPKEALLAVLHGEDGDAQWAVAHGLQSLGEWRPIAGIVAALQPGIRAVLKQRQYVARQSLRRRQGQEAVPGLWLSLLTELQGSAPLDLFLEAMQDREPAVRAAAIQALGKLGSRVPVEPVVAMLQDSAWAVRLAAVQVLGAAGEIGARASVEQVWAALSVSDPATRRMAVHVLEALGERASCDALVAALGDEDADVRRLALRALRRHGEQAPIERIRQVLDTDSDPAIRKAAAHTLAELGTETARAALLEALRHPARETRCAACYAYRFSPGTPVEPLLAALHDAEPSVRQEAAWALPRYGVYAPIEALVEALDHPDGFVRCAAAAALGEKEADAPVELLVSLLSAADSSVRATAVQALGKLNERAPVERLLTALQDEARRVRLQAIRVLSRLGTRVPLEPVLAAVRDPDPQVRRGAVEALGTRGPEAPLEILQRLAHHEEADLRREAVRTLGNLSMQGVEETPVEEARRAQGPAEEAQQRRGRVSVEIFVEALEDEDQWVRRAAVRALAGKGAEAPLEPLLAALHDSSIDVQMEALRVLGALGPRVPLEPLVAVLQQDQLLRVAAAAALVRQGQEAPLEILVEALLHGWGYGVEEAVKVLMECGTRVPVEPLLRALGNGDDDVRWLIPALLCKTHPEALLAVAAEAEAILLERTSGIWIGSLTQSRIARIIGTMKSVPPVLLDKLTELLDWHYDQVQWQAIAALGEIRRNIPDTAIRRLLELRQMAKSRAVREAADETLANILLLETGIEDE